MPDTPIIRTNTPLSPNKILNAYKIGLFPMADSYTSNTINWIEPNQRGIIDLKELHIPKKIKSLMRKNKFTIKANTSLRAVINSCASAGNRKTNTWINKDIINCYAELGENNICHCIECWDNEKLVGGLYGLAIGGVFFGESMFSFTDNASKIALVSLAIMLIKSNFKFIDTQFITKHLTQFGAKEIEQKDYLKLLNVSINNHGIFFKLPTDMTSSDLLHEFNQIS
jgi:leucyl/phenylalanyl-tRNA--protein transferase